MEQSHVLQLAHEPIPTVRIGFIGLGNRGMATLRRYLVIENIEIVADNGDEFNNSKNITKKNVNIIVR